MHRFEGMVGRAAAVVGGAAAVLAVAAVVADRPAVAQVAPAPPGDVKRVEKVAAPAPAPAAIAVEKVEVKAVAVEKVAVGKAAVPAGFAPDVRVQQLRPILRDELRVLTAAVDPTPEQRRAIALAGGRKLREIAKVPENNRPRVNLFGKRIIPNDPAKLIHDAVEAAARDALTSEQFARLQAEARARADDRREAVLMVLVAKLDRALDLGGDQRDKILDGLRAAYDEATFPTLAALVAWDNYMPTIPDGPIVAHLAPAQRTIWADAQKLDFRSVTLFEAIEAAPPGGANADPDLEAALAEDPKP